jgi:hypothetical protein
MNQSGRDNDGDKKTCIDGDKLKEGVDELLQKDQLENGRSHAGSKPGPGGERQGTDADKAKETLKDFHD